MVPITKAVLVKLAIFAFDNVVLGVVKSTYRQSIAISGKLGIVSILKLAVTCCNMIFRILIEQRIFLDLLSVAQALA